jgi:hypothetical protein
VSNQELYAFLRAWVAAECGDTPARVIIRTSRGYKFDFTVPPCDCPPAHKPARVTGGRTHSPDFRSVLWDGETYDFSPKQAAVVKQLWEAWENGTPVVSQAALLEGAESDATRLLDLFRRHPAWGVMIVEGERKGTVQLTDSLTAALTALTVPPAGAHRKTPQPLTATLTPAVLPCLLIPNGGKRWTPPTT